jgi:DNA transformation protein
MASDQATMDFIVEQLDGIGDIRTRKMFGEFCLYLDDKVVGFVCDNRLLIKPTPAGAKYLDITKHGESPYPGAKDYLRVPDDQLEEREWLCEFVRATADALPVPKPKKPKHT